MTGDCRRPATCISAKGYPRGRQALRAVHAQAVAADSALHPGVPGAEDDDAADAPLRQAPGASLDAEVGYGLDAMRGLLTPYTGVALTESGDIWRAGACWKLGPAFDVSLEASLKEPASGEESKSGLLLRGSRRW